MMSRLQNVDRVIIKHILYLEEFDGELYDERAKELLYPFRWDVVVQDRSLPPETCCYEIEMDFRR